jgi:hypothetical protein
MQRDLIFMCVQIVMLYTVKDALTLYPNWKMRVGRVMDQLTSLNQSKLKNKLKLNLKLKL